MVHSITTTSNRNFVEVLYRHTDTARLCQLDLLVDASFRALRTVGCLDQSCAWSSPWHMQ